MVFAHLIVFGAGDERGSVRAKVEVVDRIIEFKDLANAHGAHHRVDELHGCH